MEEQIPLAQSNLSTVQAQSRYQILQKIGKGCQGEVYEILNLIDNQKYALKRITVSEKQKQKQRLQFEIKSNMYLSNQLGSTKFPYLYEYELVDESTVNLYFELCQENIERGVSKLKNYDQLYNYLFVMTFQILEALSLLEEKKIIHRDIKPENILIKNGNFKLADLGLSRVYGGNSVFTNDVGNRMGRSPQFYSGSYSCKTDVWSLGMHVFYLLEHTLPFDDNALSLVRKNSNNIDEILSNKTFEINLEPKGKRSKNCLSFLHMIMADMLVIDQSKRHSASQLLKQFFEEKLPNDVRSFGRFLLITYMKEESFLRNYYLVLLLSHHDYYRLEVKDQNSKASTVKTLNKIKLEIFKLVQFVYQRINNHTNKEMFRCFDIVVTSWKKDQKQAYQKLKDPQEVLSIYKIPKVKEKFPLIQYLVKIVGIIVAGEEGKKVKEMFLWEVPVELRKII